MAFYKQACIHCGQLIDRDARFCSKCGNRNPFGYHCPTCLHEIKKDDILCSNCGRKLVVVCPHCGQSTFVNDTCEHCKKSLMVQCSNRRCGEMQFFENTKCNACGKKIKIKKNKGGI